LSASSRDDLFASFVKPPPPTHTHTPDTFTRCAHYTACKTKFGWAKGVLNCLELIQLAPSIQHLHAKSHASLGRQRKRERREMPNLRLVQLGKCQKSFFALFYILSPPSITFRSHSYMNVHFGLFSRNTHTQLLACGARLAPWLTTRCVLVRSACSLPHPITGHTSSLSLTLCVLSSHLTVTNLLCLFTHTVERVRIHANPLSFHVDDFITWRPLPPRVPTKRALGY